jgi:ribose/xylose/arabinose/galactoside ABC-type transport system permease subunit
LKPLLISYQGANYIVFNKEYSGRMRQIVSQDIETKKYFWMPFKGFYYFEQGLPPKTTFYVKIWKVITFVFISAFIGKLLGWFPGHHSYLGKMGSFAITIFSMFLVIALYLNFQSSYEKRMISLGGKPLAYFRNYSQELKKAALSVKAKQIVFLAIIFLMMVMLVFLEIKETGFALHPLSSKFFLSLCFGYPLGCLLYYRWR